MKLLLLNQYFWPDWAATAQLLGDLAEAAAAKGFEVTALAGRGVYAAPDGTRLRKRQTWKGVTIRRVACTSFGRGSLLGRISDYLTFLTSAAAWIAGHSRFDIVICLSTPPLVAGLGAISRSRGARFVYKVEDLYPDLAIELGAIKNNSRLAKTLGRISSWLLRSADCCVALDQAMAEILRQRGASEVVVIPNWADGEAIMPDPQAGQAFRTAQNLPPGPIVLYSGNLGNAHQFAEICGAIRLLNGEGSPVSFLFVGAGPRLQAVKARIGNLETVRFLPYQPRERLGEVYNAADIHLVTLKDEVAGKLVPSKYAAALAAGKPVLLVGGEGADLHSEIGREGVGWVCPHEVGTIAETLRTAIARPQGITSSGERARRLFETKYSRESAMSDWLAVLQMVSRGRATGIPRGTEP